MYDETAPHLKCSSRASLHLRQRYLTMIICVLFALGRFSNLTDEKPLNRPNKRPQELEPTLPLPHLTRLTKTSFCWCLYPVQRCLSTYPNLEPFGEGPRTDERTNRCYRLVPVFVQKWHRPLMQPWRIPLLTSISQRFYLDGAHGIVWFYMSSWLSCIEAVQCKFNPLLLSEANFLHADILADFALSISQQYRIFCNMRILFALCNCLMDCTVLPGYYIPNYLP